MSKILTEKPTRLERLTNMNKPVPMKLFAAWEVDRTPSDCIPRWVIIELICVHVFSSKKKKNVAFHLLVHSPDWIIEWFFNYRNLQTNCIDTDPSRAVDIFWMFMLPVCNDTWNDWSAFLWIVSATNVILTMKTYRKRKMYLYTSYYTNNNNIWFDLCLRLFNREREKNASLFCSCT